MEWQREVNRLVHGVGGNNVCVDCGRVNPTWASTNLGVFMCLECSGIHRAMGVHISKVKSLTLDTWNKQLVGCMKAAGNVKANRYWEARLPKGFKRPSTMKERELFIREKYQNKRWVATANDFEEEQQAVAHDVEPEQALPDTAQPKKKRIPPAQRRRMQEQHTKPGDHGELHNGSTNGGLFANMQVKVKSPPPVAPQQEEKDLLGMEFSSSDGVSSSAIASLENGDDLLSEFVAPANRPNDISADPVLKNFALLTDAPQARFGSDLGGQRKLEELEAALSSAQATLENAKVKLADFVSAKSALVKAKSDLEQCVGRIDHIQMNGLDSLTLDSFTNPQVDALKQKRKRLNSHATQLAEASVRLHELVVKELSS